MGQQSYQTDDGEAMTDRAETVRRWCVSLAWLALAWALLALLAPLARALTALAEEWLRCATDALCR